MRTYQETFDRVITHLKTQGRQAMLNAPEIALKGSCAYRAPGGLRCAIGCLIPDDLYDPRIETRPVAGIIEEYVNFPDLSMYLSENFPLDLMCALQQLHDAPECWRSEGGFSTLGFETIQAIAACHDLTIPPGVLPDPPSSIL